MTLHIHKKHEALAKEILEIPNGKHPVLHTFCDNRNRVELIEIEGTKLVIKRYKRPNICNRVIYTFFRKSKARRAYEHALRILRCGVSTPFPVAYMEQKRFGLYHTGYFVSEYMNLPTLKEWDPATHDKAENERMKKDFINFTIELHQKGILPLDYNTKNIFYRKDEASGCYKFALTDINRAKFGHISHYKDAMRSFEQLGIPAENLVQIISEYTTRQGSDLEASLFVALLYRIRKRYWRMAKSVIKKAIKIGGNKDY